MSWTATLRANASDPHPITFVWRDGYLLCSEDSMLRALQRFADNQDEVAATPTGPFAPADLAIPHVAFRLVVDLARLAGLEATQVEVDGDDWQWPALREPIPDAVY